MKMDRNIKENGGKGKYALVRLRDVKDGSEAMKLLHRLAELGHLDWGYVGEEDEFFVIKLRDKYADAAIRAYSDAVVKDACKEPDEEKSRDLFQWAIQVQKLNDRAGSLSPFCKQPD